MDLNKIAKAVAKKEGKKKSLSIGQIKEVMNIVFAYSLIDVCKMWFKYNKGK